MARGYPDFFGPTMFPYGGTPVDEQNLAFTVANLVTEDLVNIVDQGRTNGGEVFFYGTGDLRYNAFIFVWVDNVVYNFLTIDQLLTYGFHQNQEAILRLTDFHVTATTQYAAFRYARDFSFGVSMGISLLNMSGNDIDGTSHLFWARTT